MTALGDRIAAAKRHPADLTYSEWVALLEDVEKELRRTLRGDAWPERPGGWAPGIGWVALMHSLGLGDEFLFDHGREDAGVNAYSQAFERMPLDHAVIVTRWADGSVPGEPS